MQKLPVGLSDFKRVIEDNYYYVDKSLLIKELMDQGAVAMLIPRPRRFGKTLNLSMLRCFFEKTESDTSRLFRHLKIWQAGDEYTSQQGKYPVINLTFKDINGPNWESALKRMKQIIQREYLRHSYLIADNALNTWDKHDFEKISNLKAGYIDCENALKDLSEYLADYHQQRVIILIDDYDAPIQAGYINGYYEEAARFVGNFLSAGLKDNGALEKGVLTGTLWLAKQFSFSGLNNLETHTILNHGFADRFGFTESEVDRMLKDNQAENQYQPIQEWYNGHVFGDTAIHNPNSVIHYLNDLDAGLKPYWMKDSDQAFIERLLTRKGTELKAELENLIRGESIEKPVQENIVFRDLETREDLIWSFLLFSGYLKFEAQRPDSIDPAKILCRLVVPNQEVRSVYIGIVEQWFAQKFERSKLEAMLQAFRAGDLRLFEHLFREMVAQIFSYHDFEAASEKVYQAFTIGLLVWLGDQYELKSDRESGYGRYDLAIIPKDKTRIGYVIEFKKVSTYEDETVETAFAKAFAQIETRNYEMELRERGVAVIKKLAVVFQGKQVWMKEAVA